MESRWRGACMRAGTTIALLSPWHGACMRRPAAETWHGYCHAGTVFAVVTLAECGAKPCPILGRGNLNLGHMQGVCRPDLGAFRPRGLARTMLIYPLAGARET